MFKEELRIEELAMSMKPDDKDEITGPGGAGQEGGSGEDEDDING